MKPRRRLLLHAGLATLAALAAPAGARAAAPAGRPFRIYMILWRGETAVEQGFRAYLAARRINVEYIVRDAAQSVARVPEFIAEARRLKVDLVYTWGTPGTLAAVGRLGEADPARHLTDIPLVFTMVASPSAAGLVTPAGFSHRNVTGTSHVAPLSHQLRAMQAYRQFERLAVIYNPLEANSLAVLEELRSLASGAGFSLIEQPVPLDQAGRPRADALPHLVSQVSAREPQFLYLPPDSFIGGANAGLITREALRHRLPTFTATEAPLRNAEALFGLVSRYDAVGRLTASKAEQIFNGRVAGDLPVETLARFSYLLRMPVAHALDFYPPLGVLGYAEVLQ